MQTRNYWYMIAVNIGFLSYVGMSFVYALFQAVHTPYLFQYYN